VDCFLAISCAVRDRLTADRIPVSKIDIVHEGVDVERVVALPPGSLHAALFLPTHSPIVGTIGALVAQKDHHTLVEAAALVVKQVSDARFVVLGKAS
jgi:glycosyltransferase involved in cell wall biosynthesis